MKRICCVFEKPFKLLKNFVFFFRISMFVLEILKVLYYAKLGK